ncbi:PKD domain-containing protein [Halobaculum marinum]|uniref:PKD domain-containing protein n=1 Tax=Halobaculum marinum TaxID=3031996 RepID=A0ABD5WVC9_9EURY|nr:PKD domain-containing protein [Halobaculum sp. DT55]
MTRRSLALALLLLLSAGAPLADAHPEQDNDPPLVDAGLDREVDRGAVVWLDGGGTNDPDGEVVTYEWTIRTPAGETIAPEDADAVSTSFTAAETGRYEVTLTATDDHGATRSDTLYVDVTDSTADDSANDSGANDPPVGGIRGPDTVVTGESATFVAAVFDPDGEITSYAWSDGQSGREITKPVEVPAGETFSFSVRVTDDDGATETFRKSVRVVAADADGDGSTDPDNTAPRAWIEGPDRVAVGETTSFVLHGSDADGTVVSHEWTAPSGGSGAVIRHTFGSAGTYTVSGTVTDDDGATANASTTVEVYEEGPPVVRIFGPDTAPAGSTQEYWIEAYDPDGGELTISWDPAQNQLERSSNTSLNHVQIWGDLDDTIVVRAVVTDDEGNTVTAVKETEVENTYDPDLSEKVPQLSSIETEYVLDDSKQTGATDTITLGTYNLSSTVAHNESKIVRATWEINDTIAATYTDELGRFKGSVATNIQHTFVSESGRMVSRAVTVRAVDSDGDRDSRKLVSRFHSIQTHPDVTFYARGPGAESQGSTVLIEPGQDVVFTVGSYQNYRLVFGDGESITGSGTSGANNVKISHTYEDPGTYTVRLFSTQGPKGKALAAATVTVRPRTYEEYWYEVRKTEINQVHSQEHPTGASWEKVAVHDSGEVFTGRTVSVLADSGRPSMLDENWELNGTSTQQRTQRVTRISESDPDGSGEDWTLVQRNVRTESRTYYEDRYTWFESKFRRNGWRQTGETRTRRVVIGDGHDHDRERHSRTTAECTNWDLALDPLGGFSRECARWEYDTDVWYTGHDHDGRTYYETEYRYKTEVKRTETVSYHKYAGTETRTVRIKTYAETETWIEWLWESDSGYTEQEQSLTKPAEGTYISGTLRLVEVRCGSGESNHDSVMC